MVVLVALKFTTTDLEKSSCYFNFTLETSPCSGVFFWVANGGYFAKMPQ
jgi:hypothetical protein